MVAQNREVILCVSYRKSKNTETLKIPFTGLISKKITQALASQRPTSECHTGVRYNLQVSVIQDIFLTRFLVP